MLKIDSHVHTFPKSPCSTMTAEVAINSAHRANLDGIVLTEHDYIWPQWEADLLRTQNAGRLPRLFFASEVNCVEGHFLVFGLSNLEGIYFAMPARELIALAHKKGAAVVAAHPYRYDNEQGDLCYDLDIDGVEVDSSNTYETSGRLANRLAEAKGIFKMVSSDAHAANVIGQYYTEFPMEVETVTDLADYILSFKN